MPAIMKHNACETGNVTVTNVVNTEALHLKALKCFLFYLNGCSTNLTLEGSCTILCTPRIERAEAIYFDALGTFQTADSSFTIDMKCGPLFCGRIAEGATDYRPLENSSSCHSSEEISRTGDIP
jgi:hypothetical protein